MNLPPPASIEAIGVAVASVLTAWQARTAAKVRDLESRLLAVEGEKRRVLSLLRSAARHIREWMGWARIHAPGVPTPELPPELRDEV